MHIYGDLLTSPIHIGHCISADLRLSRGIALQVRERFGGLASLQHQGLRVGEVGITLMPRRFP